MPTADNTGGREARSPALAAAARARRTRLERARQGLDSGTTPAATAAQVPAITPAVGTADAMDGGVELATGNGDAGNLLGTNLENARDFMLDASDALLVCCSMIYSTRPLG